MKSKSNLYLIGPMGSGKTSIGTLLAKKINKPFYDSDQEIERSTGVSISWIFERESEEGFRLREQKIIAQFSQKNNIVMATGGGSILRAENRENLKNSGYILYLRVSLKEQLRRTSQEYRKGTRPLIEVPDRERLFTDLNTIREPLYRELADFIYETDNKSPHELINLILKDLNKIHDGKI